MRSCVVLMCLLCLCHARIPQPPTMEKQPPHEQLFQVTQTPDEAEKPFVLDCVASGNPEPTYSWKKNGEDFEYVPYDKRISQQPRRGTLVFTKPDPVDEGLYQCFAKNIHGVSVSNAVFLRRLELNSFPSEQPNEIRVIEGQPLTLDCSPPTGYPKPAIFWIIRSKAGAALRTINSSRITVDPEGDLHFAHVELGDALHDAMYACSAASVFRNEYKLGNLIILKVEVSGISGKASNPPTKQYVSPPNIVALRGKELRLSCIFGGNPLPQITWRKKGGTLDSEGLMYDNFGKTLLIRSVSLQDGGTYECTASNGQGVPQTHAMQVTVQSAPYWIKSPNNTNAAEEESVKFECVAGGIPEPKLQWFVNGEPIEKVAQNPRRKVEGNVLTVENLMKTDTSVYQCNASNIHGYTFKDFYLNVLALPPMITKAPIPVQKAVETSTITLRCRVFGAPKPEVKWMKERRELTGGRFQVLENGDLRISDVAVVDQGEYTCYASNKFGDTEAQGTLQVKGKTVITQPPENFEVAAKKSATFRCSANYDPSLTLKIEWLFNGKPIDFDRDPRMVQAADNSLTITKTMELDSGIYTCVANSGLDEDRAEATLTVQDVPNPPQIVGIDCDGLTALVEWQPMGDRRAPILGYTLQFNTSFNPDIWEDAFASIPAPDTRFKVIMSPWANYTFRVIARNKIGASQPSGVSGMCTTEEDVPYKNPDKVTGRGTTPTNLVISWTVMPLIEQNAPGFFYKVYWRRNIDGARWDSKAIDDWQQRQLVVENQPTFKEYRIRVEAHNRKGQANVAATAVIGYSGEDVPTEAPQNFKHLYVKDARSAMFSWDPVSNDSIRGHFRGYKIQAWTPDEGEDRLRDVIVPHNVTQSLVSIFKPHSRNFVRVRAFNDMYNGPPSETVEFMTPEGTPGPVASFDAYPMGSSALYLMWKKPLEPNGVLTGYTIHYQEVNETELGPLLERQPPITDQRETRAKLAGLTPSTKYRVTIRATTSQGPGEPYYIEVSTQDESDMPPDTPKFVWSHLTDEDNKAGIRIKWVPAVDGRPGSHFFAQYRRKGDGEWNSTPMEENQDTITIKGLEAGTVYEARVYAVDGRHQTPSKIEDIDTGGLREKGQTTYSKEVAVAAPESPDTIATAAWFVGMMCAIAILLLLLIIVCLIKRNRGGKYSVHEKEAAQGRDLDYPDDGGFNEYTKPSENQGLDRGSRASLNSSLKGAESDTDSMADYGEGDTGKFGEDGSFIGQYGAKKKKEEEPTSPSALATFV